MPPPPLMFTVNDWHFNNNLRCQHSGQLLANQILAECKQLTKLASYKTKKCKDEVDQQLNKKLNEVKYYKTELCQERKNIFLEIDALSTHKKRITNGLSSIKNIASDTCKRCLYIREQRVGIDLVHDNVETELLKEYTIIKDAESLLKQLLEQTHEQIRKLKATLYFIDQDLDDKEQNLNIDPSNLKLKQLCNNLNFYSGTCEIDESSTSLIGWSNHTQNNIQAASKEIQNARSLHCYIDTIINETINGLKKQKNATDNALKHHIHDTKEIKVKLELQHAKVMQQASDIANSIAQMEKIIEEQQRYLALAHTRSRMHYKQQKTELTQDSGEVCLNKETTDLETFVVQLRESLCEMQASLRYLLKTQIQIEEQINLKTNTLKIDEVQCATLRYGVNYYAF